jgi:hypothetical protein
MKVSTPIKQTNQVTHDAEMLDLDAEEPPQTIGGLAGGGARRNQQNSSYTEESLEMANEDSENSEDQSSENDYLEPGNDRAEYGSSDPIEHMGRPIKQVIGAE